MILDTNALSAFADGDEDLAGKLSSVPLPCIPSIVLGEFRYGILGSKFHARYERWLLDSLGAFSVLSVDGDTAAHYALIRHGLKIRGTPIPENDIWIAALSKQYNMPILSRDTHFSLIPDAQCISW
jgi:predicted nucleic acid-binding protein